MQSPSLSCSDNTSNPSSYFPIGCASERTIKISQSAIFLHAVGEIDRLATNFLILTSDFLTGSTESESKSPDHHRVRAARASEAREELKSESYGWPSLSFDTDCKYRGRFGEFLVRPSAI